jgi:plexin A
LIYSRFFSSLQLRFFVNIIKNPDFIFDVQKTNVTDASLSVIAQMFMDSCAAGTHQLTKDSPSSKLLFYRDVQKYKKLVEKFVRKKN